MPILVKVYAGIAGFFGLIYPKSTNNNIDAGAVNYAAELPPRTFVSSNDATLSAMIWLQRSSSS